jgi:DNA-directed RNA polymerase specialized sigma24 family protein
VWREGVSLAQLESLYRDRYDHFARVAAGVTGDGETGRDAVQHAFAAAVRKRRSFRGTGPLEAWLWRIVVNEARRLARERESVPVEPSHEAAANGRAPDELGGRAWIAGLPPRQRAALFLRYYADLDYRSIAAALGVEVGTVSATLSAAHATLRRALEEVEP